MDEFAVIAAIRDLWKRSPKDRVGRVTFDSGDRGFLLATTIGNLQVILQIVIGKRKGITEWLAAIDPTQKFELDQLRVIAAKQTGDGYFLPMSEMRRQIRAGKEPELVCRQALEGALSSVRENPDLYISFVQKARDESGASIRTVSGGLPSLGKRR